MSNWINILEIDPCNGSGFTPESRVFVSNFGIEEIVAVSLCAVFCLLTIIIYINAVYFIYTRDAVRIDTEGDHPYYLLALYPVVSITSLVSLFAPRCGVGGDLTASIYLSVCVWIFLKFMIRLFGGVDEMIQKLEGSPMHLRAPPLTCCCCCLPVVSSSRTNLGRLRILVAQVVIIRPVLLYAASALWADSFINEPNATLNSVINTLSLISTMLAVWGLVIMFRLSRESLTHYHIKPKFILIQLVLVCLNLQSSIIGLFYNFGAIGCIPKVMSAKTNADFINHTALTIEMFLLSILARFIYRKNWKKYDEIGLEEELYENAPDSNNVTAQNSDDCDSIPIILDKNEKTSYGSQD